MTSQTHLHCALETSVLELERFGSWRTELEKGLELGTRVHLHSLVLQLKKEGAMPVPFFKVNSAIY